MEDFSTLASRIAVGVGEIRGCVILSRDGLILGSYPPGEDESSLRPAWLKFAAVGDPERGFVQFGDELWVYVRRGPYAAFAVSGTEVRPGLLMDQLEQALLSAEESRARRDALKIPEAPAAPSGKPRTSLHPETPKPTPKPVPAEAEARVSAAPATAAKEPKAEPAPSSERPTAEDRPTARHSEPEQTPPGDDESGGDVDRVLLAQEFSRLLQEDRSGDDEETDT